MKSSATRRIEVGGADASGGRGGTARGGRLGIASRASTWPIYEPPRFFEALLVGRPLRMFPTSPREFVAFVPSPIKTPPSLLWNGRLGIEVTRRRSDNFAVCCIVPSGSKAMACTCTC